VITMITATINKGYKLMEGTKKWMTVSS